VAFSPLAVAGFLALLVAACNVENRNTAGGAAISAASVSPEAPSADLNEQAGQVNVVAKTELDAALARIDALEGQVGGFNLRIGDVTITSSGWGLVGSGATVGGALGLLLYFLARYTGVRPSSPEQREDKANGVKIVKAVNGGGVFAAVCPLCGEDHLGQLTSDGNVRPKEQSER
jgi:hypothetical protein